MSKIFITSLYYLVPRRLKDYIIAKGQTSSRIQNNVEAHITLYPRELWIRVLKIPVARFNLYEAKHGVVILLPFNLIKSSLFLPHIHEAIMNVADKPIFYNIPSYVRKHPLSVPRKVI